MTDPKARKLVLTASISRNDQVQQLASKALLGKSIQRWEYPFETKNTAGNVSLGNTFQNRPFTLSEKDFTKHFLAVGQTGSGKTTLFYNLMDEIETPFWAFDLKQDYRHLIDDHDLLVLPWTQLKFNPLKPPEDVPPRRWIQVFAEIFGHATALLSGSKNYLMKQMTELYKLYNLFEHVSEPYPSLHELEKLIKRDKINYVRKSSDYRDTLQNRLEAMTLLAGTIFDCSQGHTFTELLQRDVVFEFDGLSRDIQNFLMEIILAYVYEYRLAQNHRNDGLAHVFFLDEGKRVFSVYKERQDAAGIPEIDELTAKMREFGEGLIVADQEASKLTDSIKANAYTKALLSTAGRKQFDAMTEAMNLSQRQADFARELDTGEAIIQTGNEKPTPVKLSQQSIQKQVSDTELERKQREKWGSLTHEIRKTTTRFDRKIGPTTNDPDTEPDIPDDPTETNLSREADRLLEDVVENPFKPLTERYQLFSNNKKSLAAKTELLDQGLVIERRIKPTDFRRKLLELTEKGRKHVETRLDQDPKMTGRGNIVHRFWQHQLVETFETQGWHAFLEKFDADVYVNMGDTELAVEIAMGNNHRELEHVKKHLKQGLDAIWIVGRTDAVRTGLEERFKEAGLQHQRLSFHTVHDLTSTD